jgi:hypothetical protein
MSTTNVVIKNFTKKTFSIKTFKKNTKIVCRL